MTCGVAGSVCHERLPDLRCLLRQLGTDLTEPRCVALTGEIGKQVSCSIYDQRPSPCREFDIEHAACNRARQRCGLAPL